MPSSTYVALLLYSVQCTSYIFEHASFLKMLYQCGPPTARICIVISKNNKVEGLPNPILHLCTYHHNINNILTQPAWDCQLVSTMDCHCQAAPTMDCQAASTRDCQATLIVH